MIEHMLCHSNAADKGGAPLRRGAMWAFIGNMREFWKSELGRDFTFAQRDGLFQGEAAIFCWDLLKLIHPDASRSEFCAAMRAAVELDRPGRGRHPNKSRKPSL
jgi:hypothetical protein